MTAGDRPVATDGLLVVDKPAGWTSHDVVAKARGLCGTRRVGHAGTLDPMATGVLVLGVNRATKLLTFLVGCDKTYTATIRLGQSTLTDDAEGEVTASYDVAVADRRAASRRPSRRSPAPILQVPSAVSAIKVDGKRSYARVRAGEDVVLPARPVTVHRFSVLARPRRRRRRPRVRDLDVEVEVSSGTYVRALARDLGAALGTGGHLTALRRTRVGRFDVADASSLEALQAARDTGGVPLVPLADAARASFAARELSAAEATAVGYGQRVPSRTPLREEPVAAFAPDGALVAMLDERGTLAKAHVVFAPSGS